MSWISKLKLSKKLYSKSSIFGTRNRWKMTLQSDRWNRLGSAIPSDYDELSVTHFFRVLWIFSMSQQLYTILNQNPSKNIDFDDILLKFQSNVTLWIFVRLNSFLARWIRKIFLFRFFRTVFGLRMLRFPCFRSMVTIRGLFFFGGYFFPARKKTFGARKKTLRAEPSWITRGFLVLAIFATILQWSDTKCEIDFVNPVRDFCLSGLVESG